MARIAFKHIASHPAPTKGAISDFDLTAGNGECVVLFGSGDSGASTVIALASGLEPLASGDILFDSTSVAALDPAARGVGLITGDPALYPHLPVEDNIMFPLRARRMASAEARRLAREVSDWLHLAPVLGELPQSLPADLRMRAAVARALVHQPPVLLLDSFLRQLDLRQGFQLLMDLKRLLRARRQTTLMATDDLRLAPILADRVAVMSRGSLLHCAAWEELCRAPANVEVARLVSDPAAGIFGARRDVRGRRTYMMIDGSDLIFEIGQTRALAVAKRRSDSFIVAVRPQKLALANHERGESAEVIRCEFQGERTIVEARNGAIVFTLAAPPETALQPGSTIKFTVEPEDVLVFDRSTGRLVE